MNNECINLKNRTVYIDCDFVDQSNGSIIWHRRFNVDPKNNATYRKKLQDITDSLIRSSSIGNYSILLSVCNSVRQMQDLKLF